MEEKFKLEIEQFAANVHRDLQIHQNAITQTMDNCNAIARHVDEIMKRINELEKQVCDLHMENEFLRKD